VSNSPVFPTSCIDSLSVKQIKLHQCCHIHLPTELTQYPPDTPPPNPYPSFKAVHHLPGHMRKPPNLYSSTVYASEPGAIVLHPAPRPSAPRRVDVPGVPGAFVVLDVFTPEECLQIVKAAEGVGFEKDEAAGGSAINKQSVSPNRAAQ
jgi:hypothetical protein